MTTIATRWTQGNDILISLTMDNGVHSINEILQRFQDRSPNIQRLADPRLLAMAEDWYEQPDEVREAIYDLYRLICV